MLALTMPEFCAVFVFSAGNGARLCDPIWFIRRPHEAPALFSLLIAIIWELDDFSSRLQEGRMTSVENTAREKKTK